MRLYSEKNVRMGAKLATSGSSTMNPPLFERGSGRPAALLPYCGRHRSIVSVTGLIWAPPGCYGRRRANTGRSEADIGEKLPRISKESLHRHMQA